MSSPHVWGCFQITETKCGIFYVFPTCVGVFPLTHSGFGDLFSLPHMCGGVSAEFMQKLQLIMSSPHVWGVSKIQAFYLIPKALKEGLLLGKLSYTKEKSEAFIIAAPVAIGNTEFKLVHTFVAPLKIAGNVFVVKLTAKEEWNGNVKLYDHQALEMPNGIYESTPDKSDSIHRPALGELSVEQMLTSFKGENLKYIASKVVDENGEPLVVYHGTFSDIASFQSEKAGSNGIASGLGFFFTDKSDYASEYAEGENGSWRCFFSFI